MGQHEVFNFLARQRKIGNNKYFESKEVYKALESNYIPTRRQLNQLYVYGYLEIRIKGFTKTFRLKKKYINTDVPFI